MKQQVPPTRVKSHVLHTKATKSYLIDYKPYEIDAV